MVEVRPWARPRPRLRRRIALVVVVALVATGALVWGLDRRSNVTFDVPAAQPGLPGTWEFTHTVEPPEGGTAFEREVTARSSRSTISLRGPTLGLGGDTFVSCRVEVWQRGVAVDRPRQSKPVRVGTAPAVYAAATGVHWTGPGDQPANVHCFDGPADAEVTVTVAAWVRFTTELVAVPFRLGYLPPDYRADKILFRDKEPPMLVLLPTRDSPTLPHLAAYYYPGPLEVPGRERATVNGRPVVMDAYHRLLCFTEGPTVCVTEYAVDPMGNGTGWPVGVRGLLTRTAAGLVVAPAIDDRSTWFEGREAFPG
jgi:hypothetical protein